MEDLLHPENQPQVDEDIMYRYFPHLIKEASRAFTGWTIAPKLPRQPLGRFHWGFEFKPEDHDDPIRFFQAGTLCQGEESG